MSKSKPASIKSEIVKEQKFLINQTKLLLRRAKRVKGRLVCMDVRIEDTEDFYLWVGETIAPAIAAAARIDNRVESLKTRVATKLSNE